MTIFHPVGVVRDALRRAEAAAARLPMASPTPAVSASFEPIKIRPGGSSILERDAERRAEAAAGRRQTTLPSLPLALSRVPIRIRNVLSPLVADAEHRAEIAATRCGR